MDNNLNNIDELFAKGLEGHSMDPPAHIWENIQSKLDATTTSNVDDLFSKGLAEYAIVPPAYVWDNIKTQLDAESGKRRLRIGLIIGTASAVVAAFVGGYFIANNMGINFTEEKVSEKISGSHNTEIDVNHFWNLRKVIPFGKTDAEAIFLYTPISNNSSVGTNTSNNVNSEENGSNSTNNVNTNSTINNNDGSGEYRIAPDGNIEEKSPVIPSQSQSGGSDAGKKTDAVAADVKGFTENPIGINGSTTVTEISQSTLVNNNILTNTETQNTFSTNNDTEVEKSHAEVLNPNDPTTFYDEKGNKLMQESFATFTVLPYFSPTYTWRNSSMTSSNGIQSVFDSNNANGEFKETPNFSYSTGVLVGYNFTEKLTVFIGASFNTFSNTTNRADLHSRSFDQINPGDTSTHLITTAGELNGVNVVPTTTGSPEDPTYLLQDNDMGKVRSITQTFSSIEVPVLVRYRLGGKRVGVTFTGGISTGFLVQNDVTLTNEKGETRNFGQTDQVRNFNMNAIIGVGIEVKILPYMFLDVQPTFKYSFINHSMDSRFQMNPFSLGLNTGLSFKF